ncbi:MAG TPA: group 1 truncated hemoglobin [Polyangia bacterium]|nr:group 1 truncated hemoglobin [Polyangia bacterium]
MKKLVSVSLLLLAACAHSEGSGAGQQKPLYDRLGGKDAITAVVDNFVGRVAKDDRINARFGNTDIPHLKAMLVDQICQASGGPCTYTGKDMKTAHKGMNLTDGDFNALVEDLVGALNELKVAQPEQKELLGALGGMKGDIVGQ